jgi:hypothetical protein
METDLHASRQSIETLLSREYWLAVCPELSLLQDRDRDSLDSPPAHVGEPAELREALDEQGYFVLSPDEIDLQTDLAKVCGLCCLAWKGLSGVPIGSANMSHRSQVSRGVLRLIEYGWDPLFLAVYDDIWRIARRLEPVVGHAAGGNLLNHDFLAWCIDPQKGAAGFSPHRDR